MAHIEKDRLKSTSVIPQNGEVFKSVSINSFCFIDSYAFLPHSLDKLMKDLNQTKQKEDMMILNNSTLFVKNYHGNEVFSDELRNLALQKGKCPFEKMNNNMYLQKRKLPPKSHFYSKPSQEDISDEDYNHAGNFWKKFKCKNLLQYVMTYCHVRFF